MKELDYTTHFSSGGIEELTFKDDPRHFRWTRKVFGVPDGLNFLSDKKQEDGKEILTYEYFNDLILTVERYKTEQGIIENYTLKNSTEKPIEINDDYFVKISFADDSDIALVSLQRRAYLRVFQGGNCFCVYNSRMGGQTDGVGLVLTSGELEKVKKERLTKKSITVLSCFFKNTTLAKDEQISFSWLIFGYEDQNEFLSTVYRYMPFFTLHSYPIFENQEICVDTPDELLIDGISSIEKKFLADRVHFLKVQRGERFFEIALKPLTKLEYVQKIIESSSKKRNSAIIEKLISGEYERGDLLDYLKKSKKEFDMGVPIEKIEADKEAVDRYLSKTEYALSDFKGVFSPYKLLARADYLSNVGRLNADVRISDKKEEIDSLVNAFFRLNLSLNEI